MQCFLNLFGHRNSSAYMHASEIAGSVPEHRNKVSHNLFAGGGSCLQFKENTTPVKCNKVKHKKRDTSVIGTLGSIEIF